MRYAVFSDVHGNLPALAEFVDQTRAEVDAYICLGDLVNYGPWNDECIDLALSLPGIVYLEGNHERMFLGVESVGDELPLVQAFYEHSLKSFSKPELISNLPLQFESGDFLFVHTLNDRRIYADSSVELSRNCFIGHSHHQFRRENNGFTLVNCGSLGQNRGVIDVGNYAIYDSQSGAIELRELAFDFDRFLDELRSRRYPQQCIDYYTRKTRRNFRQTK